MRNILDISNALVEIARCGGELTLLDTDAEIEAARQLINEEVVESSADCREHILKKAAKLLSQDGVRFQVSRFFSDNLATRCVGRNFFGLFYRDSSPIEAELVSPIELENEISFQVFYGGFGYKSKMVEVELTANEWNYVTSPLRSLRYDSPQEKQECSEDFSHAAFEERMALSDVVARFEIVVGTKAGTKDDVGGIRGNNLIVDHTLVTCDYVYPVGCVNSAEYQASLTSLYGQQDCVDETRTTRGLIDALIRNGLVVYHSLDPDISFFRSDIIDHEAVVIFEKQNVSTDISEAIVVDSWPRDNGELPDIINYSDWISQWSDHL